MTVASTYHVTGLHCKSCVSKTESALRSVPGVNSAHVTLIPPQAIIETSRVVTKEVLDEAVRAAGNFQLSTRSLKSRYAAATGRRNIHANTASDAAVINSPIKVPQNYRLTS